MRPLTRTIPRYPSRLAPSFSTYRPLRLKEDKPHDPEELEKKKQKAQNGEKDRDLQSSSEEAVGADQEKVKDNNKHMEELQKQTAQKSEENHPQGKS